MAGGGTIAGSSEPGFKLRHRLRSCGSAALLWIFKTLTVVVNGVGCLIPHTTRGKPAGRVDS
jgi:hypothetical protein